MKLTWYSRIQSIAENLRTYPEIRSVKIRRALQINVKFNVGIVEHWVFRTDIPFYNKYLSYYSDIDNMLDDKFPEYRCQFTRNPLYPEDNIKEKFFSYSTNYLNQFCLGNYRIFLYRLANELSNEGYVRLWYPDSQINDYYARIRNQHNYHPSYVNDMYKIAYCSGVYDDIISPAWTEINLARTITKLHKHGRVINRYNIIRCMHIYGLFKINIKHIIPLYLTVKRHFNGHMVKNFTNELWVDFVNSLLGDKEKIVGIGYNDNEYRPLVLIDEIDIGESAKVPNTVFDELQYVTLLK